MSRLTPKPDKSHEHLPETELLEPDQNKDGFEAMLADYVAKHGASSEELIRLSNKYSAEKKAKKKEEVTKNRHITRRAALRTMGGILGTAAMGAAAAYYSKEAAEKAAEDAAEKRLDAIKEDFKQWQLKFSETAFALMDEMFKFLALFKKSERWIEAGKAAFHGAAAELFDFIQNRDKKPDKIKKSFEDMIKHDPELKKSFEKINQLSDQLKKHIENFSELVDDTTDWQKQRDAFMKDFFDSFMNHLLGD